jgi:uroporphyrinogen-III decarboxylase
MPPTNTRTAPDVYHRVLAVLQGRKPDRIPFIDRLELWFTTHRRAGTLPAEFLQGGGPSSMVSSVQMARAEGYAGMSLPDIHRAVGMGQQVFETLYARQLRGTELRVELSGETIYRQSDPVVDYFPKLYDILPADRPGVTTARLSTPVGTLTMRSQLVPDMVDSGTMPYMQEHPIKDAADVRVLEWVMERAEYVPKHEKIARMQADMGDIGFVMPFFTRVPFQRLLLDFCGEVPLFFMIHDAPQWVERMMALLHERMLEDIRLAAQFAGPYVQFPDNVDGVITNPELFKRYSLPYYQKYIELLHAQGKAVGSHTDGNLRPILGLLAESGLDVCESFSPAPLTACPFDEAWAAWAHGPIIWGGIPSPILQPETPEDAFRRYVDGVLETVGSRPIILGVGDMVMGNNLIERVRYIADRVEERAIE